MTRQEKAVQYFNNGFHCSQAVLASYADECGLSEEQALKIGACFGGGMRKAEVCGACSGALMVLGSLYGQYDLADEESRQTANEVNDQMIRGFEEACGSYLCREILGCDISTPEGKQCAREKNLFKELCPQLVANAVTVLEKIIGERQ
jgi:C_GCAxxG_C_C family probable redox protein